MKASQPKISIIIPVYNGSDYLREAIQSALGQSYANREVIIVNDGSTDNGKTEEIARSFGSSITYISKQNGGVSSALNAGIRAATGEYIAWLSHDDVFMPDKLEVQVRQITTYQEPVILYSDYYYINSSSAILGVVETPHIPPEKMIQSLLTSYPINGCTILIPKVCLDHVGLFNEQLQTVQDAEMWFRLANVYKFIHVPYPLLKSRMHKGQGTYTMRSTMVAEQNDLYLWVLKNIPSNIVWDSSTINTARSYAQLSFNLRMRGYRDAARQSLDLAFLSLSTTKNAPYYCDLLMIQVNRFLPRYISFRFWKYVLEILRLKIKYRR